MTASARSLRGTLIFLLILVLLIPAPAMATIASKLDGWFTAQNFTNTTRPGVYETQSARYGTLGGVSYRAPIRQPFRFLTIQTPRFSAGCGGIDLFTGGFSVMNADQFVDALRAIGQNAISLAFMLAIQIVSPQLAGIMEDIQSWANKYLSMASDSCEAATAIVGGALELFGQQEGNCTLKRMQNSGEDYNTANYNCTTGGQKTATEDDGTDANKVSFTKGNMTWWVLMQNPFFRADLDFSILIMNLVGTVIIKDTTAADSSPDQLHAIPTSLDDSGEYFPRFKNIVTALLHGSDAPEDLYLYTCTDRLANATACINIQADPVGFSTTIFGKGLQGKVDDIVADIVAKIKADTTLAPIETGLIGASHIPLYRFLSAASAASVDDSVSATTVVELTKKYTALYSRNILLRSLNQVLELFRTQIANLPDGMHEADNIKEHAVNIRKAMTGISKLAAKDEKEANNYFDLLKEIRQYELIVMTKLGKGFMQAARWGG